MRMILLAATGLALAAGPVAAQAQAQAPSAPTPASEAARAPAPAFPGAPQVDIHWGARIPMRDGVELNAVIYRPTGQTRPGPVIVTQTPYVADEYHERAMGFAARGYAFVIVDVRGRGSSEGEFEYHAAGRDDGHDVVEWLARQPWSNGQVAGQGGSYAGANQWLTAAAGPEGLRTIMPRASAYMGLDVPMRGGISYTQRLTWVASTLGRAANDAFAGDILYWGSKLITAFREHVPFNQLDTWVMGRPSELFQTWLAHPSIDRYYTDMRPSDDDYRRIDMPVLSISGYYDGSLTGSLAYYREHLRHGPSTAARDHYLILGPWDHALTGRPRPELGGMALGDASVIDMGALQIAWYDWVLKGGPRPAFLQKNVAYFTQGANEWRYADRLDAIPTRPQTLYLTATSDTLTTQAPGGLADQTPGPGTVGRYAYDPLDVEKSIRHTLSRPSQYTDQTAMDALDGDGLVYDTPVFETDTDFTGIPEVTLFASMDVPDTDFQLQLYEMKGDGKAELVSHAMLRARYRNSLSEPELAPVGEVVRYHFDNFHFFSRRVAAGSRLRLVITAPNSVLVQKNYNSGGDVSAETAADARVANVVIHQGPGVESRLVLPLAP